MFNPERSPIRNQVELHSYLITHFSRLLNWSILFIKLNVINSKLIACNISTLRNALRFLILSCQISAKVECCKKIRDLNDICSKNIHVTLLHAQKIYDYITKEKLNRRHEESFGKERNV